MSEVEYAITIARQVPNPKYRPREGYNNYDNRDADEREPYEERTVTSATLTTEQWAKVQRAIVEALT